MRSKEQSLEPEDGQIFSLALLFTLAFGLLGLFTYTGLRQNLLSPVWIYFFLYLSAYALYVYAAARIAPLASQSRPWVSIFIVSTGIVFRTVLIHAPPSLSTDIYRYIWDGRLTVHGVNPFRWSPFDPRLAPLRDWKIWMPMEYKPYQTVYMSISQLIFAVGSLLFGDSLTGYKLMYTLFDIGNMILLWQLLKELKQPTWKVIWYAWCPLPIIEVSLSGHQDVCGVFFFLLTFVLFARSRIRISCLTLAASVLTKGFPLLLIPLLARRAGWRYAVLSVVSLIVLGLPQILEAHAFLHGMQQYLMNVEVNGSVHALIDNLLTRYTPKHLERANQITDLIIIGFVVAMVINPLTSLNELMRRTLIIVCSCLLVVPTLFPWYLVWLIPIAACVGNRPSTAIIVLIGTSVMNYTFYFEHETYWWSAWVEYVPFYTLLFWEWYRGYWRSTGSVVSTGSTGRSMPLRTVERDLGSALTPVDG